MQIIPRWFHNAKMLKPFSILCGSWVCHPSPSGSFPASQPWALNSCLPLGCCVIACSSCHCPHQPGTQLGSHLLLWLIPASSHYALPKSPGVSVQCIHPCPPCWTLPWDPAGSDGCSGSPHGPAQAISQPSMLTLSPLLALPLNPHLITLNRNFLASLWKPLIQNWDIS